MTRRQVLAAATAVPLAGLAGTASAGRPSSGLGWAGRAWTVRSGTGGPGPNRWSGSGPYVADGALHLRVRQEAGGWTCSEVFAPALGFGTYEWTVRGPVGQLDANVVLGLFTYETDTRETDLELARWGGLDGHNAQYAVQPAGTPGNLCRFTVTAERSLTMRYRWTPGRAEFSGTDDGVVLAPWSSDRATTSKRGKVHMNLWLHEGRPPTDGRDVDVALTAFRFTPV